MNEYETVITVTGRQADGEERIACIQLSSS